VPAARLVQVNLQTGFGGGEIYTCFLGAALRALGRPFELVVHRDADWWRTHDTAAATIHPVRGFEDLPGLSVMQPTWFLYHTLDAGDRLRRVKQQGSRVGAVIHMPVYQRRTEHLAEYDRLFAVSEYVRSGLLEAGLEQTYAEPLYGIAHLDRAGRGGDPGVVANPRYAWDTRKVRDRVLSWLHPAWHAMQRHRAFERRDGLTLGIVSRLTPIKQFPDLFAALAPVLGEFPGVHLEIFGSGGYASVRDLRRSLAPLAPRVRWWGHQDDVRRVYPLLDYMLAGLPEKEALGLNVLEAQVCGTPVLAPAAPPFTETIVHGRSGYLYPDPRHDGAAGFRMLLADLVSGRLPRPDPRLAKEHLARFGEDAFRARIARLLEILDREAKAA